MHDNGKMSGLWYFANIILLNIDSWSIMMHLIKINNHITATPLLILKFPLFLYRETIKVNTFELRFYYNIHNLKSVFTGTWNHIHIKVFAIEFRPNRALFLVMVSPKKIVWTLAVTKAPIQNLSRGSNPGPLGNSY